MELHLEKLLFFIYSVVYALILCFICWLFRSVGAYRRKSLAYCVGKWLPFWLIFHLIGRIPGGDLILSPFWNYFTLVILDYFYFNTPKKG